MPSCRPLGIPQLKPNFKNDWLLNYLTLINKSHNTSSHKSVTNKLSIPAKLKFGRALHKQLQEVFEGQASHELPQSRQQQRLPHNSHKTVTNKLNLPTKLKFGRALHKQLQEV